MAQPRLQLAADADALAAAGGAFLAGAVREALSARGRCVIGLSGGRTPRGAYAALGLAEGIDWTRVTIFLVDERMVPAHHEHSNARLAEETLLAGAAAHANIVFPDTSLSADGCAADYDARLQDILSGGVDVIALGLGEDGHIASLFPPVSAEADDEAFALHAVTDRFDVHDRITATLTALQQAKDAVFLLSGTAKKKTWDEMTASTDGWQRWPAKRILERCETTVIAQW